MFTSRKSDASHAADDDAFLKHFGLDRDEAMSVFATHYDISRRDCMVGTMKLELAPLLRRQQLDKPNAARKNAFTP